MTNRNPIRRHADKVPARLLRYFRVELYKAISFVLVAFVGLFAFFDMVGELDRLSSPGTSWFYFFVSVMLGLPARIYEIAPIAALIGSIYALVQIAASSEFTAMRAAGLSTVSMLKLLMRVGLGVVLITVFFGEVVTPVAERLAVPMRAKALGYDVDKDFKSGYWLRDTYQSDKEGTRVRYVNFSEFTNEGELSKLEYYEFDEQARIRKWVRAESADFNPQGYWTLKKVQLQSYFDDDHSTASGITIQASPIQTLPSMRWDSNLNPVLLTGLFVEPDRMSAWQLYNYSKFLKSNLQSAENIDLAFAKKVMYPFAVLIMMMISLPFAYLHFRSGGVSVKVFAGIMIGVAFHLINNLFSHLSMVAKLPPFLSASVPSVMGFVIGMAALWWVSQPAPWRMIDRIRSSLRRTGS